MKRNLSKSPRLNESKDAQLGLPETLKAIKFEKCVATVSAKVEPSLKEYLKQHGGSAFIHTLIMQSLCEIHESRQRPGA